MADDHDGRSKRWRLAWRPSANSRGFWRDSWRHLPHSGFCWPPSGCMECFPFWWRNRPKRSACAWRWARGLETSHSRFNVVRLCGRPSARQPDLQVARHRPHDQRAGIRHHSLRPALIDGGCPRARCHSDARGMGSFAPGIERRSHGGSAIRVRLREPQHFGPQMLMTARCRSSHGLSTLLSQTRTAQRSL